MDKRILFAGALACAAGTIHAADASSRKPNVIFIMADDMGYADLGCYGQTGYGTPHIDSLAEAGIRFTDCYSASPISSPSRAGFLTGRYPARMGIRNVFFPDSYTGMSPEEVTIAEVLKTRDYSTCIIGKWHLGHLEKFLPLQQGFDEYFGIPYSNDMRGQVYIRGNEVESYTIDPHLTTSKYTEEAIDYIERHADVPFFLYLAYNMVHVPIYVSQRFEGITGAGPYADAVAEMDWSVGEIVNTVRGLGLEEDTIIIFTSDNGPWLQEGPLGGCADPLKDGKGTDYEGGVRVPCIVNWKGTVRPAVNSDVISLLDWFPTLAGLCGGSCPADVRIDGHDISGLLLGTGSRDNEDYAYFRDNFKVSAYRSGEWKIMLPDHGYKGNFWRKSIPARDTVLINLKNDAGETRNLYGNHPEIAEMMLDKLEKYRNGFGEVPPPLVQNGNNFMKQLDADRKRLIEEAKARGVTSMQDIGRIRQITETYRIDGKDTLCMKIVLPSCWDRETDLPAAVFFFGGGWNSGSYMQFMPQAMILARLGIAVFLPDYRVKNRHGTTPFDAVADAKSAMRFIRGHGDRFHIDPDRIIAGGGSAGGHLAAACACLQKYDNYGDDLRISPVPDALVLFNPVIDNSPEGYGYERIGKEYPDFSPMHNIRRGFPPTLVVGGSEDRIVADETLREFARRISDAGSRCRIEIYDGAGHGFFNRRKNDDRYFRMTMDDVLEFLEDLEYITNH